jgi:hypothetical protein
MEKVDYLVCPGKTEEERAEWERETLDEMNQETTDFSKVDFFIDKTCKIPMSYAMCKTEEDVLEWYAYHHPELPEDIAAIAARATANPTALPQKGPPAAAKGKREQPAFNIEHGEATVDFS